MAEDVKPETPQKDMTIDYINQAREIMQKAIETTNCGYCKMIVGDSKEILDKYIDIIDTLKNINTLQSAEKKYLTDIKRGIYEMYGNGNKQINNDDDKRVKLMEFNPIKDLKAFMPGIIFNENRNNRIVGRFLGGFLRNR